MGLVFKHSVCMAAQHALDLCVDGVMLAFGTVQRISVNLLEALKVSTDVRVHRSPHRKQNIAFQTCFIKERSSSLFSKLIHPDGNTSVPSNWPVIGLH